MVEVTANEGSGVASQASKVQPKPKPKPKPKPSSGTAAKRRQALLSFKPSGKKTQEQTKTKPR